jgi:D123
MVGAFDSSTAFLQIPPFGLCTTLAGISQRDMTQRFDSLVAEKEELQDALLEFHEDHIMARFPLWDCESPLCTGLNMELARRTC